MGVACFTHHPRGYLLCVCQSRKGLCSAMSEMAAVQAYKPMYKVRPYFVIKKVKLPDCMYLLKPLHKLPSLRGEEEKIDTERALDSLEYRQENIISRIKDLQEKIKETGQKLGLSPDELQQSVESHVPSGTPLDVVIKCSPSNPPYSLLALCHHIKKPMALKSFAHSSALSSPSPALLSLFNMSNTNSDSVKLKITVIWKEEPQPVMMVSPGRQIPIEGLANACRYLTREFCPEIYESLPHMMASRIDSWLDTLSTYLQGSTKEKASVLRTMNATLGTSSYLVGNSPTLCDIVLCPAMRAAPKLGNNVKAWVKRCDADLKLDEYMPPNLV